jgi:hypothetical protein
MDNGQATSDSGYATSDKRQWIRDKRQATVVGRGVSLVGVVVVVFLTLQQRAAWPLHIAPICHFDRENTLILVPLVVIFSRSTHQIIW